MTRSLEHELMRLLHGELPSARAAALRERMKGSPELAAEYERLERTWAALELPPPQGVPPGFAGRVMARVAASREPARPGALSWRAAPGWVRAAAAGCLIAGAALGAAAGGRWTGGGAAKASPAPETALLQLFGGEGEDAGSLNDSYWGEVADSTLDGQDTTVPGYESPAAPDGGAAAEQPL